MRSLLDSSHGPQDPTAKGYRPPPEPAPALPDPPLMTNAEVAAELRALSTPASPDEYALLEEAARRLNGE